MRVIKKYKNRKIYDTRDSQYITLSDLLELITNQEDFVVVEHGSDKDITDDLVFQAIIQRSSKAKELITNIWKTNQL